MASGGDLIEVRPSCFAHVPLQRSGCYRNFAVIPQARRSDGGIGPFISTVPLCLAEWDEVDGYSVCEKSTTPSLRGHRICRVLVRDGKVT